MMNGTSQHQCNFRTAFAVIYTTISVLIIFLSACTKEKPATVPETKGTGCIFSDKLPPEVTNPLDVNFENRVRFVGVTLNKQSQDQLEISYYWQMINDLDQFKNVYVHFTDSSGNVLFQNDHEFCPKRSFDELKGKVIRETFLVSIPEAARGQEIYVKLGVYVPEPNGPRLKILSAGNMLMDEKNTRVSVAKIKL